MELDTFTFIPPQAREQTFRFLARLIGTTEVTPQELTAKLTAALRSKVEQHQLVYLRDGYRVEQADQADAVQFSTALFTPNGEEIVAVCAANKRAGAQPWFGVRFEVLQRPGFAIADLYFPNWHDGPKFLAELAEMAIKEKWKYDAFASRLEHPILKSYLAKTYERVKQQGKVVRAGSRMLFNTGLINRWFKEIYVVAEEDPHNASALLNAYPILENDRMVLEAFKNQKPGIATYFSSLADVMFDPALDVVTDDIHIIEDNKDRIPARYWDMPSSLNFVFQSAVQSARVLARRNYKLVVPQFYAGRIQFLMPIFLSGEFSGVPDCALALERIHDSYRGNTILTLDMAYQNARLIAKPDPTWLDPETITESVADRP